MAMLFPALESNGRLYGVGQMSIIHCVLVSAKEGRRNRKAAKDRAWQSCGAIIVGVRGFTTGWRRPP